MTLTGVGGLREGAIRSFVHATGRRRWHRPSIGTFDCFRG